MNTTSGTGHRIAPSATGARNHSHTPPAHRAWAARGILGLATGTALLAVLLLGAGAAPAYAQGEVGNVCAGDFVNPANCTANDVLLEAFFIQTVIEDCAEGTPFEAEVVFEALVTNNSPDRYGIGLFVALDGGSALSGDMCLHDFLEPFSSDPGDWQTDPMTGAFIPPFPEINDDQCGDIPSSEKALKQLQQVRIACNDSNDDGFVDISACSSWENNAQAICNGLGDAIPGTPAKCGCQLVDTTIPLPASVTIVKETTEGDGTFEFTADLPGGDFSITTAGGSGEHGPLAVNPGTYSVSEVVPDGWTLDSATCDNGDSPDDLTVASGDVVTCTFVDSPTQQPEPGSITIVKVANGGNRTFSYEGTLGAFGITTVDGTGNRTFNDLAAGNYDVIETVPADWELDSIACSDDSQTDLGARTAHIDLAAGESVTCTFTNSFVQEQGAAITIVKQTVGGNGTFNYTGDLQPFAITTEGGSGSRTFDELSPGTYNVAETAIDGWTLSSITCSNEASSTNVGTRTATIVVAAEEQVTCTFVNQVVEPVPSMPRVAFVALLALLASVAVWTLRRDSAFASPK